jgi:hypothetical protein
MGIDSRERATPRIAFGDSWRFAARNRFYVVVSRHTADTFIQGSFLPGKSATWELGDRSSR